MINQPTMQMGVLQVTSTLLNKPKQRRSWKKPKGKPNRPLSAYNLFFQVERERILKHGENNISETYKPEDVLRMSQWHKVRPRRPHRKSHGKISFRDLSSAISRRWKALDMASRQVFDDQAKVEKQEYLVKVAKWEQEQQDTTALSGNTSSSDDEGDDLTTATVTPLHVGSHEECDLSNLLSSTCNNDDPFGLNSSLSSLESLESLDEMINDVLDLDLTLFSTTDSTILEPPAAEQPKCSMTAPLFESVDDLMLLLSVTHHHQNIFGVSSWKKAKHSPLDHDGGDLMHPLDSDSMDSMFD